MSLSSISISDLPKASHTVVTSDGTRVSGYTAQEVVAMANAFLVQAACQTCEDDGIHATDGTGPYDCYSCGKKARPLMSNHDTTENEG